MHYVVTFYRKCGNVIDVTKLAKKINGEVRMMAISTTQRLQL